MGTAHILFCLALLAGACTSTVPAPSIAPSAEEASPAATRAWIVVSSPSHKPPDWNFLNAVSAVGPDDAWAVGAFQTPGDCCVGHALIEHWDGDTWTVIPNPGAQVGLESPLNGVVGVSATDVWTVGQLGPQPLIEHWDGATWTVIPSPKVDAPAWLGAITAVSEDDIWAVGSARLRPLVEHWDGRSWSVVPTPRLVLLPDTGGELQAIAASSASDVWAVGEVAATGSVAGNGRILIEHWDGRRWHVVVGPKTGPRGYLTGVTALSTTDAWAVGYNPNFPLFEHWDGRHWHLVSRWPVSIRAGRGPFGTGSLSGVAARSSTDVWAVGVSGSRTRVEHWNGTRWSLVPSPNRTAGWNGLNAVWVGASGDAWAVGSASNTRGSVWQTLVEQFGVAR